MILRGEDIGMKLLTSSHATGALCGALLAIFFLLYYQLRVPIWCTIIHTSPVSPTLRTYISDLITPAYLQAHTATDIQDILAAQITSLDTLTVRCTQPYHRTIVLSHTTPCAQINHTELLGINGAFLSRTEFVDTYCEQLPQIWVLDTSSCTSDQRIACATFAQSLPASIIAAYTMVWHNKTEIFLYPSDHTNITVIVHAAIAWNESLLTALNRVTMLLAQRMLSGKKEYKNKSWLVDIRIPEYIIVRPEPAHKGRI